MPVFTVFAVLTRKGKHRHKVRNTPLLTFYEMPISWSDLKDTLLVAARHLYFEHDEVTADITISSFLKKRYLRPLGYERKRIHYGKQLEFTATITYLKFKNQVEVKNAFFVTPDFLEFKDAYDFERGKKWEIPPLVPPGFEASLFNPDLAFTDPLTLKTPNYAGLPRDSYMPWQQKTHAYGAYAGVPRFFYAGKKQRVHLQDEYEEEHRH
jgi:hypothetical protein